MPSFWNWLCFPQKKLPKQNTRKNSSKRRNGNRYTEPSSIQKRKLLLDAQSEQFRTDLDNRKFAVVHHPENVNSAQRLVESHTSNKRRRVQDIFNTGTEETHETNVHTGKHNLNDSQYSNHLVYSSQLPVSKNQKRKEHHDFGSGYTPGMYKIKNEHRFDDMESMYGYTPKIVQNVYASTALEGRKIDDFFGQLHRESSLSNFAHVNDNQFSLKSSLSSKLSFHPASKCSSVTDNQDKLSLIEHDVNGNSTVMEWNENWQSQSFQSPLSQHMTELNFEKIWGSGDDGEVLY